MPSFEEHCRISELRTGKKFEELHKWMDEPQKQFGKDHRNHRHGLDDIETVRQRWGDEGVIEFLVHIIVDFRDTKNKLEKLFHEVKKEKEEIIGKNKELTDDYNDLFNQAQGLVFGSYVGVPSELTGNHRRK